MLAIALQFLKDNWVILSAFIINEVIAISPSWASGSIGQLVINVLRMLLSKPPISVPAPAPKV